MRNEKIGVFMQHSHDWKTLLHFISTLCTQRKHKTLPNWPRAGQRVEEIKFGEL